MEETISLWVGIIGTAIAIYQWAVLNENKKKLSELQYLFAGINSSALQKQVSRDTQIRLFGHPVADRREGQRDFTDPFAGARWLWGYCFLSVGA